MMRRFSLILFLITLLPLPVSAEPERPDILLITIDTLRADRLGCYGYKSAKTPVMDRIASQGALFENAVAHVPLTRPSHASIFTGLYPFHHGIRDNIAAPLDQKHQTLAEILKRNGYQTAAFVSSFVVNSQSGLQRGFDLYQDRIDAETQPGAFALMQEKRGSQVFEEFSKWHGSKNAKPYFAWVHLYDPHFPYEAPAPFGKQFAERPYDGEVAYSDSIIGKILKTAGPQTWIILTSDHGESLGDHGENSHSYYIYDATLRVPLILRWAGKIPAARHKRQARSIDLFATVLDYLSIQRPENDGVSLKPMLSGAKQDEGMSYAETFTPYLHFGWSPLQGLRTPQWKYIHAPQSELYDLISDPAELKNVIKQQPAVAKQMRQQLEKSGALEQASRSANVEIDPEELERLASLGYAGVSDPKNATLDDPKLRLEDFKLFNKIIREGIEAFQNASFEKAAAGFQKLKDRKIHSFEVHYYLGRSLLKLNRHHQAVAELNEARKILPHFLPVYQDLASAYEGLQQMTEAQRVLEDGLRVHADHPALANALAWLHQRHSRLPEAAKILESELKAHPDDFEARFRLGSIYRDLGRAEDAMRQWKLILKETPDNAEAHNQLGMIYGASGKMKDAAQEFELAAKLAPDNASYRKNLQMAKSGSIRHTDEGEVRFRVIETFSRAAADVLLRRLSAGESWESLSVQYSVNKSRGEVLTMKWTEIDPDIREALRALPAGKISAVIENNARFFLLKKEN